MKKMDKELIEHISSQLQSHELPYDSGAWERFSKKEKKRRVIFYWPLWTAAALILIFGGLFYGLRQDSSNPDQLTHKSIKRNLPEQNSPAALNKEVITGNAENAGKDNNANQPFINEKSRQSYEKHSYASTANDQNPIGDEHVTQKDGQHDHSLVNSAVNTDSDRQVTAAVPLQQEATALNNYTKTPDPIKKPSFEELLAQDSKGNQQKTASKNKISKWEPGVYIAPAMGNDNKVNMNYGFSLSYNVASKLSISSGIAYTALSTTSNPIVNNMNASEVVASANVSSKGAMAATTSSKSLESVNANLRGINIPLELKYTISNKFYTGIGVSALAILNNKTDNNYLVSTAQNTTVANVAGFAEQRMLLVTERVSEPQAETTTASDKYIGFYNFSFGYKQKISKHKNFAVEPFLRVPMKTFSTDNLNLTNGGLRLKLDF